MIRLETCGPVKGDPTRPDLMIRQIVGRCHVGDPYRAVLREVIGSITNGKRQWRAVGRDQRRLCVAMIVHEHNENRATYRYVMGGHA